MDNKLSRMRRIATNFLVFGMAAVSIIIAIADLSGLLDNSNIFVQRIPALTLLSVGFIASYLLLDHSNRLDEILQSIETTSSRTIQSLKGVEIRVFDDGANFLDYFEEQVKGAKRIDDINWRDEAPTRSGREAEIATQLDTIVSVAKEQDVVWREIVAFSSKNNRFERVKRLIEKEEGIIGYNVAYYNAPMEGEPPRLTFAIVGAELFLARPERKLAVRHPDLVEFFTYYYEDIWKSGAKLKKGNQVYREEIHRLESSLH